MSSTMPAVCGINSDNSAPHCPYFANLNFGQQLRIRVDERRAIALQQFGRRQRAVELGQLRLVIEHLQVARRSGHKEENDVFGLRSKVGLLWSERGAGLLNRRVTCAGQQVVERERAHSDAALFDEPAAREIT